MGSSVLDTNKGEADLSRRAPRYAMQPNSTVLKHKARNYFFYLDPILLKGANADDPHGIVRK